MLTLRCYVAPLAGALAAGMTMIPGMYACLELMAFVEPAIQDFARSNKLAFAALAFALCASVSAGMFAVLVTRRVARTPECCQPGGELGDRPLQWPEVGCGMAHLADKVREYDPDIIIGILRGGAIVGGMLHRMLKSRGCDVKCFSLIELRGDGQFALAGTEMLSSKKGKAGGKPKILLADDAIRTGTNVSKALGLLTTQFKGCQVKTCVLSWTIGPLERLDGTKRPEPNFFAFKTRDPDARMPW